MIIGYKARNQFIIFKLVILLILQVKGIVHFRNYIADTNLITGFNNYHYKIFSNVKLIFSFQIKKNSVLVSLG